MKKLNFANTGYIQNNKKDQFLVVEPWLYDDLPCVCVHLKCLLFNHSIVV